MNLESDLIIAVKPNGEKHGYGPFKEGQLTWKPEINLEQFSAFELWLAAPTKWKTKNIPKTEAKRIFGQ